MASKIIKVDFIGDASSVEGAAKKTEAALGKVAKASGNSTQAMINFNRVIQDAPYGIQGIANNIDPLLTSLGATAGLSFVVSLATSALVMFGKELFDTSGKSEKTRRDIDNFTKIFGEVPKSAKVATEGLERYNEMVSSIVSKNAEESVNVTALVDRLSEANTTRKESIAIIGELQKVAPEYFAKLDKEKASVADVAAAYADYNAAIVRTIETQIRLAELQELVKERLDLSRQNVEAANFINSMLQQGKTLEGITSEVVEANRKNNEAFIKAFQTNKFITAEQEKQLLLQNKIPAGVELIIRAMQKEKKILDEINKAPLKTLGIDPAKPKKGKEEEILVRAQITRIDFPPDMLNNESEFARKFGEIKVPAKIVLPTKEISEAAEIMKEFQDLMEDVGQGITDSLGGAFQSLFEGILSGSKSAFAAFAQALGNIIKKLIATAAASAVLAAILGPLGLVKGGAGGTNLTGIKAFFQLFRNIGGFDQGGVATGPRSGYLAQLHGTEVITPIDKWVSMMGGSNRQVFIPETRLQGGDIYIAFKQAEQKAGRLW